MKLTTSLKTIFVGLSILTVVVCVLFSLGMATFFSNGQIWGRTLEQWRDPGYFRWFHGEDSYREEYFLTFTRDKFLRKSLIGKPIGKIQKLFPAADHGVNYDPSSYRAIEIKKRLLNLGIPPSGDVIWIGPGDEYSFGYCVYGVNGKIVGFMDVKG